ncbi:DUF397 domain-containing protein [Streptomyces varsoviensis]|uniref:DUF397 domain-containing protein n=1 Tax=Streptomyces varsoviensis TaxID=67373 RepID=UPI0033CD48D0
MASSLKWQKSSYSAGGEGANCLELAEVDGLVWLRESEAPDEVVAATPTALRALLRSVKASNSGHLA